MFVKIFHKKSVPSATFLFQTAIVMSMLGVFLAAMTLPQFLQTVITIIDRYPVYGSVFAGLLYGSTLTLPPALAIFYLLEETQPNIHLIALLGGLGAMVTDHTYLWLGDQWRGQSPRPKKWRRRLSQMFEEKLLTRLANRGHYRWLLRIFGALLVASPFPDEIGLALLGVSRLPRWHILMLTFLLNAGGILFLLWTARSLL